MPAAAGERIIGWERFGRLLREPQNTGKKNSYGQEIFYV